MNDALNMREVLSVRHLVDAFYRLGSLKEFDYLAVTQKPSPLPGVGVKREQLWKHPTVRAFTRMARDMCMTPMLADIIYS